MIVSASRYDVTTQDRWLAPPRSLTMVGSAVATIAWSRAASNMPSMIATTTAFRVARPTG
jgi:hypothetical protein